MRKRRGTTPLATPGRGRSSVGCDGPTRSVLLDRRHCRCRLFFRRLPGDGRIDAVPPILRLTANRDSAEALSQLRRRRDDVPIAAECGSRVNQAQLS